MVTATVTTSVEVIDSTARTVDLDQFEVGRLGEGRVDIVATQTDAAGNLHAGEPKTAHFTIDTVNPTVDITDDQDGTASDGENSVTYTLTFSEPVQSVTAGDLEVDGGVITDVDHTPGEMTGATAKVTVTVDDDSTDPVEIKVTSDILDVAGNPLITKTDSTQQVDTDNPSTKVADGETTNPAVSAELITDSEVGDTLKVSFTFDEAMDRDTDPTVSFTPDIASTIPLTPESGSWKDDFTFEVTAKVADDNFDANEVTIDITGAKDAAGNLQEDHNATVELNVDI